MKHVQRKNNTKRGGRFLKVTKLGKSRPKRKTQRKKKKEGRKFSNSRKINPRKINYLKRRKTAHRQKKRKNLSMKGGGIPFSEVSTLWDKTMFQFQEFSSPFFDKNMSVAGNAASNNPSVTHQFDRVHTPSGTGSAMVNTPDIGTITNQAFPDE